jgi:hypothetical protein
VAAPEAEIGPLEICQNESSTCVRAVDFAITLPGRWFHAANSERFEMRDDSGHQQLFVTKRLLRNASDLSVAREAVEFVCSSKKRVFDEYSDGRMRILKTDCREANGQVELRLEAHDAQEQLAAAVVLRANRKMLLDFTIYQYGIAAPGPQLRANIQLTFDMIQMQGN